eukprot:907656-Pyramimonas_sp.AAC.1
MRMPVRPAARPARLERGRPAGCAQVRRAGSLRGLGPRAASGCETCGGPAVPTVLRSDRLRARGP